MPVVTASRLQSMIRSVRREIPEIWHLAEKVAKLLIVGACVLRISFFLYSLAQPEIQHAITVMGSTPLLVLRENLAAPNVAAAAIAFFYLFVGSLALSASAYVLYWALDRAVPAIESVFRPVKLLLIFAGVLAAADLVELVRVLWALF